MSNYIIGSFNIQHLNNTKDFKVLAKIIKDEGFDVIAIQEARSRDAVRNIVTQLNPSYWAYAYPSGNEEYAFIWKRRRLRLFELPNNRENPQILKSYHYRRKSGEIKLVRPPFVGYFTAQGLYGGCNFDLRLINTHITFSKPANAPLDVNILNSRRNELNILSRDIYGTVSDRVLGSKRSIFTVLLGDYNLVLVGEGPKIIKEGYTYVIKNGKQMIFDQREKSTLKKLQDSKDDSNNNEEKLEFQATEKYIDGSGDYYSRNYDHFGYDDSLPSKYVIKCSRVDAVDYYKDSNKLKTYREKISDHVPIKLEITLK